MTERTLPQHIVQDSIGDLPEPTLDTGLSKAPPRVPDFLKSPQVDPRQPVPVLLLLVGVLLLPLQRRLRGLLPRQLLELLPRLKQQQLLVLELRLLLQLTL